MSSHPIAGDTRYEIRPEHCGHEDPHYVLRWCGGWIASDPAYAPLVDAAKAHAAARETVMDEEFDHHA